MPRTGTDERPTKRQKNCINYYLLPINDDSEQDGSTAAGSPMTDESPAQDPLPSKTPAVGLLPNGLPPTGLPVVAHPAAAVGQINTMQLQSLGRRFLEQQTLETPAVRIEQAEAEEEEIESGEEDEDGFKLFSQLDGFERVISQHQPDDVIPLSQTSLEGEELETDMLHVCRDSAQDDEDPGEGPSTQPAPATVAPVPPIVIPEPAPGLNNNSLTPAVHSVDRVQLNSGGPQGVFPIFRSRKDCKTVYVIRHGESEYNRALAMHGSGWEEPQIYDARLTMRGRGQASALRSTVHGWNLPENVVWITSPLTRAIETMLLAFPGGPPYPLHNTMNGHDYHDMFQNVFVLPEVTEHLMTNGDIGRNPEDLAEQFPQLHPQLSDLPERWWYNRQDKVNCSYLRQFGAREPKENLQRRIKAFRQWILSRPEETFVAVGHSVFWKAFATSCKNGIKQESLKNCSWMQLHV